jgi:hypothetical protein
MEELLMSTRAKTGLRLGSIMSRLILSYLGWH